MLNHCQPTLIIASSVSRGPKSKPYPGDVEASASCHLELSWMPTGIVRQWMWMRVWRGDGMMVNLLGCVMAMQRKHGGWEEVLRVTRMELRWRETDGGAGDVTDRGERRSGGQALVGCLWGDHFLTGDRVRGREKWFETPCF